MNSPARHLALVERPAGLSRYAALAEALRQRIFGGEWPPGTPLPAEQALAIEHGVALGTMRQALQMLVQQGMVERRHGKGTYVREGLAGAPMLRFFRFGDGTGEVPRSRIVSMKAVAAPVTVATALGVGTGEQVLRLHRLRSLQGVPRLVEDIWLPLPLFSALLDRDPAEWGDLLYPFLVSACGVHVHRAVDEITFGRLGGADARSLRLPAGHPCATVQRRAFDWQGRCIEWRTTRGDADAFHYTVSIT